MTTEIEDWLEKDIETIKKTKSFIEYFEHASLEKIENTYYLANKHKGIEVVLNNIMEVTSIQLHSQNFEGYKEFTGKLIFGLSFSLSREDVREKLGTPHRSGGGNNDLHLGYIPYWDKFILRKFSLHLQYCKGNSTICLITLGSLKLETYFRSGLQ